MAKTKDEKFVLSAYDEAKAKGDLNTVLDRYEIGAKIGIHPKGVDTICRLLAQANFIKPIGKTEFMFTSNGIELAENLQGS